MPDLDLNVQKAAGNPQAALVVLAGSIDAKTVPGFQEQLNRVKDDGVTKFVLDMENIKYVNSTGLGFLVNLADSLDPKGGGIALVKLHPKVKVVFDMLGLNAFFKIFNNRTDAMAQMAGGAPSKAPEVAPAPAPVSGSVFPPPMAPAIATLSRPQTMQTQSFTQVPAGEEVSVQGQQLECASCKATLVVPEPGNYKCPRCSAIFTFTREGKANFLPRRRLTPIQMTLTCSTECTEGLVTMAGLLARRAGFNGDVAKSLESSVRESAQTIIDKAYASNEQCTYQVLMVASDNEVSIKFSDYGKVIPADDKDGSGKPVFSQTRKVMDVFDLKAHPKGGNILTLSKRSAS
ncbi:MAG: STAS domain-containing protein [Candidatus Brocadiae bacterium]|nr:STAS domain-containing protein [Candidatus Brocadiia bacterium]